MVYFNSIWNILLYHLLSWMVSKDKSALNFFFFFIGEVGFSPKGKVGEKSFPVFLTGRVKLLIFFGLMNRIYWNVSFECLLRLMLSELHGSVVWYFVINYGKFSPVITLNISSSFSFWYSSYISVVSCSCPIVLGYCVLVLCVAFVSCICFFPCFSPPHFS